MPPSFFEIRVCSSCGLRYPLTDSQTFGERCPHCMGETKAVLKKQIENEPIRREKITHPRTAVMLDNIRSAWNVGSILRSADGFGFGHAYLCGITPTPENDAVKKTSLGAENFVAWSHHKDAVNLVERMKMEGWKLHALEEDERAKDIRSANRKPALREAGGTQNEKRLLIVGNEVTGIDPELLARCDEILFIPMSGRKRSLNVAIAFSVAAFALSGSD